MSEPKNIVAAPSQYSLPVLVASRSGSTNNQIRMALKTIGYSKLIAVSSHALAVERLRSRGFFSVIFDAQPTDMPVEEFVRQAVELDPEAVLIAVSHDPRIDDVFNLLRLGARGFVVMPFSTETVAEVLDRAKQGPPFSESVLQAPDRNAALAGVVLNNLYRISVLMRQSREFPSAAREVDRFKFALSEAVELARLFCEGGSDDALRDRICDDCMNRAATAASRLGRTRVKLKKARETATKDEDDDEED